MPTSLSRSLPTIADSGSSGKTQAREVRPLWVWWHLLSLDAPTVAVVWCWFFGAVLGFKFSAITLPTLALGTWCVYVADRLLDGWRSTETIAMRDRHWFYLRHRKLFVIAWLAAAVPLAWLICFRAQSSVRTDDILLCLIGLTYFLIVHGRSSKRGEPRLFPGWLPKEMAVGFLFATATAVPVWARVATEHVLGTDRGLLIAAILIFGAVCWLNCVAIQVWEDADAHREPIHAILGTHSEPEKRSRDLTAFLGRHLAAFAFVVGVVSIVLAVTATASHLYPLFASVAISAALFLALIHSRHRFSTLSLRVAADAALLTPLIFILLLR